MEEDEVRENKISYDQTPSRPRSVKSWRSRRSRTRSRSNTRPASLTRLYSAGFHDDHGVYVGPGEFDSTDVPHQGRAARPQIDEDSTDDAQHEKDEDGLEEVEGHDFGDEGTSPAGDVDRSAQNGQLEKAPSLSRRPTNKSAQSQREHDPNMVRWNGADDPDNPKNWKMSRKWIATIVVSSFVGRTLVCSYSSEGELTTPSLDIHFPSRIYNGRASIAKYGNRPGSEQLGGLSDVSVHFHPSLRFRSGFLRSALRSVWPRSCAAASEPFLPHLQSRLRIRTNTSSDASLSLPCWSWWIGAPE